MEEKKELEIVSGDISDLDISPVYDTVSTDKPKSASNKQKNIVVPKELKNDKTTK